MPLLNANLAAIEPEKVRDYLLSPTHPVGRFKADFFAALGFAQDRWQELELQIREHALAGDVAGESASEYGQNVAVDVRFAAPSAALQRSYRCGLCCAAKARPDL